MEDIYFREFIVRHRLTLMEMPGPPSGKPRILSVPEVIRTSAFFRRSIPAPLGPFVLRYSSTRPIHLGSRPARDNHWSLSEQTWLVLAERYLTVHDGPLHCLFYSQSSAGNFRPLS